MLLDDQIIRVIANEFRMFTIRIEKWWLPKDVSWYTLDCNNTMYIVGIKNGILTLCNGYVDYYDQYTILDVSNPDFITNLLKAIKSYQHEYQKIHDGINVMANHS